MTNLEAKAIIEANAVPVFPLQIAYQDWLTAIHMAEEALDKQIPKKPAVNMAEYGVCPTCGRSIDTDYCIYCGQALDWSEED